MPNRVVVYSQCVQGSNTVTPATTRRSSTPFQIDHPYLPPADSTSLQAIRHEAEQVSSAILFTPLSGALVSRHLLQRKGFGVLTYKSQRSTSVQVRPFLGRTNRTFLSRHTIQYAVLWILLEFGISINKLRYSQESRLF
jgi:hypothetical protein